jgi:hypothetical protein
MFDPQHIRRKTSLSSPNKPESSFFKKRYSDFSAEDYQDLVPSEHKKPPDLQDLKQTTQKIIYRYPYTDPQKTARAENAEIQTKLTVGAPNDGYEQEADRVADQVMSMPDATHQPIQRAAMPEKEEEIQTKRSPDAGFQAESNLENRLSISQGGGSPLPDEVRSFMEPRFGADFSQVRVHTDSEAVQMNRELNAQAFTHKQDVYFGAGKAPANDALTAHELTHVVQQTDGIRMLRSPRGIKDIANMRSNEKELDAYEDAVDDLEDFKKEDHPKDQKKFDALKLGSFFVKYKPSIESLFVTVQIKFDFKEESHQEIDPQDLELLKAGKIDGRVPKMLTVKDTWTPEQEKEFKTAFLATCSASWSGKHTLYAHKDWWESLKANVVVSFINGENFPGGPNYIIEVHKEPIRSSVKRGFGKVYAGIAGTTTGVHESGHMLGLGDEYPEEADDHGRPADHSQLVEAEFGPQKAIIRGKQNPASLMASGVDGKKILPEHGVTFLEAIKDVAPETPWHLSPKPPKPIPKEE